MTIRHAIPLNTPINHNIGVLQVSFSTKLVPKIYNMVINLIRKSHSICNRILKRATLPLQLVILQRQICYDSFM